MGVELDTQSLQPGLNFAAAPVELFPGTEMGEDAFRLLGKVQFLTRCIHGEVRQEALLVKAALKWAKGSLQPAPSSYPLRREGLGTDPMWRRGIGEGDPLPCLALLPAVRLLRPWRACGGSS